MRLTDIFFAAKFLYVSLSEIPCFPLTKIALFHLLKRPRGNAVLRPSSAFFYVMRSDGFPCFLICTNCGRYWLVSRAVNNLRQSPVLASLLQSRLRFSIIFSSSPLTSLLHLWLLLLNSDFSCSIPTSFLHLWLLFFFQSCFFPVLNYSVFSLP